MFCSYCIVDFCPKWLLIQCVWKQSTFTTDTNSKSNTNVFWSLPMACTFMLHLFRICVIILVHECCCMWLDNKACPALISLSSAFGRGKVGDVYIVLHVDEKAGIRRDGLNLYSKINIDYTEAILGTVIKVILALSLSEGLWISMFYYLV